MDTKKLCTVVLKKNLPHTSQQEKVSSVLEKINKALRKRNLHATAMLGGSVAKDTHLSLHDCDIFVVFNEEYKGQDISSLLATALPFSHVVLHGSRDYFQAKLLGISFEFVPVLNVSSYQVENVTDLSPLHVSWVTSHIGSLRNDVRLAKVFCKAQNSYGAESHINGFSGYILELLIIAYGGFLPLLKSAKSFRPQHVIDISHAYKNRDELFKKMNASKYNCPLIVVDPVQPERNAAAAVSETNFARFVLASKLFLAKPSLSFFEKKNPSINALKQLARKTRSTLLFFTVSPIAGKEDVVGGKIVKLYEHFLRQLQTADFRVLDKGWWWDKEAFLWYLVYPEKLPLVQLHAGPLVYGSMEHLSAFLKKHNHFIVEKDRLYALRRRKFATLKELVNFLLAERYVKDRVKKISCR